MKATFTLIFAALLSLSATAQKEVAYDVRKVGQSVTCESDNAYRNIVCDAAYGNFDHLTKRQLVLRSRVLRKRSAGNAFGGYLLLGLCPPVGIHCLVRCYKQLNAAQDYREEYEMRD